MPSTTPKPTTLPTSYVPQPQPSLMSPKVSATRPDNPKTNKRRDPSPQPSPKAVPKRNPL